MKILFIADKFDDEPRDRVSPFPGGAELTDSALIESSPFKTDKIKFRDLSGEIMKDYDLFIIGNSKSATEMQLEDIVSSGRYILFEHDMRICRYDGDYLRAKKEPVHYYFHRCICPHIKLRKLYSRALGTVFLTNKQLNIYKKNPFFRGRNFFVLGSSAMNRDFLKRADSFIRRRNKIAKRGTAVFYSPHRAKGYEESHKYCFNRNYKINLIKNVKPDEVLNIFERSERFVYLPESTEWAGRMVIEARFLGCKLVINDKVGVAGEKWWKKPDNEALEFLKTVPERFWNNVREVAGRELN